MPGMIAYGPLMLAIVCEVAGTAFLQKSEQFTKPVPTAVMTLLYVASFYLLSHALKTMNVGVAYAIWSGLGMVLTAAVGLAVFRQVLDVPAMAGIGMIIAGVIVMNVFSETLTH